VASGSSSKAPEEMSTVGFYQLSLIERQSVGLADVIFSSSFIIVVVINALETLDAGAYYASGPRGSCPPPQWPHDSPQLTKIL